MSNARTFEAFQEHARTVTAHFEKRRMVFLKRLMVRSVVALLLLVSFPAWFSVIAQWDSAHNSGLSTFGFFIIQLIAGAVLVIGILIYAALPLFRYRYYTIQIGSHLPGVTGIGQQTVSLKSEIFGELLRFFGDFTLYNNRKITLRSLRNAPGLPEYDDTCSEDYIRGKMNGVGVELMEAALTHHRPHGVFDAFHGLMVVLDISDPDLVLRGTFSGKTLLVHGAAPPPREADLQRIPLVDSSFDSYFEAYSNNPGEARKILTESMLRSVLKLSEALRSAREQVLHMDDKLAYAVARVAEGLSEAMAVVAKATLTWIKTGSILRPHTRHDQVADVVPALVGEPRVVRRQTQCAFYDDKILLLIPYEHNLFEPDPIFRPPLRAEDIALVYTLITNLDALAQEVVRMNTAD